MEKILIIEDNKDVNMMLAEALSSEGYLIKSSFTGIEGIKEARTEMYDLILLDIMLPYKSGDEILREIREFSDIPVIIISAKDMVGTKIDLLKLGADDYITKPFDLGEVAARIATNLRRSNRQKVNKIFKYKDMVLDPATKNVMVNDIELDLTAKEYLIIELLMQNLGKVFSKGNIYESIWKEEYLGDDNAVKTHMSNLRTKLKKANPEEEYIETVWGLGYRLYKE
ncbi:response regulator transcription factor [Clostridium sp. 'White wine YQ']|uniref:response regulator transcription factor n=1 Tax=Clostridium sp. 'White wine YQ' TaxID=3027474 RepID=UPI002366A29F|nr:response regulator transcription factor [Clostridium sp. 'White wine YQ']MDD7794117.1 response regulator transcription factor [Clostridium sp. 'White wine YQ']